MPKLFAVGRLMGAGRGYLPQTRALIAAMTTPPTAARAALIDQLMVALVNSGIFAKLDLFYMLCAADSQAARLNWIFPGTNTATAQNSPTFTADHGYTGDGIAAYLDSGLAGNAAAFYKQASATIFVVSLTDGQSNLGDAGANAQSNTGNLGCRDTSNRVIGRIGNTANVTGPNTNGIGVFAVSKLGTVQTVYANGSEAGSADGAATETPILTGTLSLLRSGGLSSRQEAAGGFGANLSAAQHAALNAAVRQYINGCTPGLLP